MSERQIRRILIALDASPASLAAAELAAELAERSRAELVALFVEDSELLGAATLPAHAGGPAPEASAEAGPDLARRLQAHAAELRQRLERLARRHGVTLTFQVARGEVTGEVLKAAAEADLVALGRVGWARGSGERLGRTASAVLARGGGLLQPFHRHHEAVLLVVRRG
jgi:nucleotide-binding universal stress UspA family protein